MVDFDFYVQFGQRVRYFRRHLRLSQERLADMTQIGRATVASIESGRQAVALHQAIKLSEALKVDIAQLVNAPKSSEISSLGNVLADQDLQILEQLRAELV